jgi:hypothetical protein
MGEWPGTGQPADSSSQQSSVLRDRFDALFECDFGIVRASQQTSPDLTLQVTSDRNRAYVDGNNPVNFAGGNSPPFSAPSADPRIDLLHLDKSAVLAITQGAEAGAPVPPTYPQDKMVICEVYNRVGQTSIKNLDDATNGYIFKRRQPIATLGAGGVTILDVDTGDKTITGTGETPLYSITIAGGILGADKMLRFIIFVTTDPTNESMTIRLKYGGTTLCTAVDPGAGTFVMINGFLAAKGATNAQRGMLFLHTTSTTGLMDRGSSTIDSTASQTLEISGQKGGSPGTFTTGYMILERLSKG